MSGSIFFETAESSVLESDGVAEIAIRRTGDLSAAVTVEYLVSLNDAGDEDVETGVGTVTIPAGVDRVVFPVNIVDDSLAEPTETFTVSIVTVDSGTLLFPRTTRVDILDDENPSSTVSEPPLVSKYDVTETTIFDGLTQPIAFEFSPENGNLVYVAEKGGLITLRDSASGLTVSTVIDLSQAVNDTNDRGLMDIALHPDFGANPYLYAFYVVDPPEAANETGNAGLDGIGNRFAHVVRMELDASTNYQTVVPGSQTVILGAAGQSLADISGGGAINSTSTANLDLPSSEIDPTTGEYKQDYIKLDSLSHAGGALEFGPDGALYVSIGDGTSYNATDPRTLSVQDINSLSGKILRVDPITGQGLADNPFVAEAGGNLDANAAKVYQLGLRNPYSMSFDVEGKLFITNTGWSSWEDVHSGGPGANFGWPYYEGGDNGTLLEAPGYRDLPEAQAFYDAVARGDIEITASYRAFSHRSADPGFQVQAITGADDIINSDAYPESLQGHYIFTDVVQGEVFSVSTDDRRDVEFLYKASSSYAPVHLKQGPDGMIYYADLVAGTIGRLDIEELQAGPLTFNGKRYEVVGLSVNWSDAQAQAAAEGGRLLSIDSQAESDFIMANFWDDRSIFLDGSDEAVEGRWVDSDGQALAYTNWLPGEPNNGGGAQHYARIATADGRWDDGYNDTVTIRTDVGWIGTEGIVIAEFDLDDAPLVFDGKRYEVVGVTGNWTDAQVQAAIGGGRLLSLDSQAESDFVMANFWDGRSIFLDGSDEAIEGRWVDSEGRELAYTNWLPGEPNNAGGAQHYARIATADGRWDDGYEDTVTIRTDAGWSGSEGVIIAEFDLDNTNNPMVFNGKRYEVVGVAGSWSDAQALADAQGGRLLSLDSQAESNFVMANLWDDRSIFLDGSDEAVEGRWVDSDGQALTYTNWLPGEPNNAGGAQHYARIASADGRWDDGYNDTVTVRTDAGWIGSEGVVIAEFDLDDTNNPLVFNGKRYEVVGVSGNWSDAQARAEAQGGRLLSLDSQAESNFVLANFWDDRSIFLDGSDEAVEGRWVDSDGQELTYTNWLPGEPNNAGGAQHYARIATADGRWDDGYNDTVTIRTDAGWTGSEGVIIAEFDYIV